jgi:hypothetical protein
VSHACCDGCVGGLIVMPEVRDPFIALAYVQ